MRVRDRRKRHHHTQHSWGYIEIFKPFRTAAVSKLLLFGVTFQHKNNWRGTPQTQKEMMNHNDVSRQIFIRCIVYFHIVRGWICYLHGVVCALRISLSFFFFCAPPLICPFFIITPLYICPTANSQQQWVEL